MAVVTLTPMRPEPCTVSSVPPTSLGVQENKKLSIGPNQKDQKRCLRELWKERDKRGFARGTNSDLPWYLRLQSKV